MSREGIRQPSSEAPARRISIELIKRLGTYDIPFTFRTASNSVYVADKSLRTIRYKTVSGDFQPASTITVFLDHKYMDPNVVSRNDEAYVPNSLINKNGRLILAEPGLLKAGTAEIQSFADIPQSMDIETIRTSLYVMVFDSKLKKVVTKTPVSLMPQVGYHPLEFCDPQTNPYRHRNHLGNPIEDLLVTNKLSEEETQKAIEKLAATGLGT